MPKLMLKLPIGDVDTDVTAYPNALDGAIGYSITPRTFESRALIPSPATTATANAAATSTAGVTAVALEPYFVDTYISPYTSTAPGTPISVLRFGIDLRALGVVTLPGAAKLPEVAASTGGSRGSGSGATGAPLVSIDAHRTTAQAQITAIERTVATQKL